MQTPPFRWQSYFVAASLELGWGSASLIIAAVGPVDICEFGSPDLHVALLTYIHSAPTDEQRVIRAYLLIEGHAQTSVALPKWRGVVATALWKSDLALIEAAINSRRFADIPALVRQIMTIPPIEPWMRGSVVRVVSRLSRITGALQRELCALPRAAEDIEGPTPGTAEVEAMIPDATGAVTAISDIAARIAEDGTYEDLLPIVLRAIYRHGWWPTWRHLQWVYMHKPQLIVIVREIREKPWRFQPGALKHAWAVATDRAFPRTETSTGDDVAF